MSEARKEPNASAASSGTVITGRSPGPANRVSNSRQRRPHTLLQQRLGQDARDERRDQREGGGYDKPPLCCQRACGEFADHDPSARAVLASKMLIRAQDIPKSRLEPVTYVTGATALPARNLERKTPHRIGPRRLRPAPDFSDCGHNSARFPPLSSPLRRAMVACAEGRLAGGIRRRVSEAIGRVGS